MLKVALPSLFSAGITNRNNSDGHANISVEKDANARALEYFKRNESDFNEKSHWSNKKGKRADESLFRWYELLPNPEDVIIVL